MVADWLRFAWPRLLEWLLVALLVVQLVRLVWTMATPVGPLGDWNGKAATILSPDARARLFRSFDPFYPAPVATTGTQTVTSLSLSLFGVRVNEGSGLGSAIISGADGVQQSYAVGDEIMPGVTLKSVAFDHVVIDHNGVVESLYLDQSDPVTPVAPAPSDSSTSLPGSASAAPNAVPSESGEPDVEALKAGVGIAPRISQGHVTGLLVNRQGSAFDEAGFHEGDVIVQINGRPIGSAGDAAALQRLLAPGARISLMVERGAHTVPIAILVPKK